MNREYRKRLFDILDQLDELAEPQAAESGGAGAPKSENGQKPQEPETRVKVEPNHDCSKRYSPEFKKMVVRLHKDEGRSFTSITEEYGVSKPTITKWCSDARYENRAKLAETSKELRNAQQEYEKVKEENVFLKKIVIMMLGMGMEVQQP